LGEAGARQEGQDLLRVSWATPEEFRQIYLRDLAHGALFVPTREEHAAGDAVRVRLEFPFCAGRLELDAEVVATVSRGMAHAGARPGISVQASEPVGDLRRRLEGVTGLLLPGVEEPAARGPRRDPRFPACAAVVLESSGCHFPAETVDVSYNGLLALLVGVDLGQGNELRVVLTHPGSGVELAVDARVANRTRCHHGVMALGIRFFYAVERIEEVRHFIDDLRGFHRARELASVTGSLSETPLEAVLETFAAVSNQGTLILSRKDDEGKVAYRDGQILYAMTGLVSGPKALGRMFGWTDAQFEFRPELTLIEDAPAPLALQPAILAASLERDEVARLSLGNLGSDAVFSLDEERFAAVKSNLDPLRLEIAENAGMGFPLGAILDILTIGDAAILMALADLIEGGIVVPA
jgi:Tfp pilus assembly protein PilZ